MSSNVIPKYKTSKLEILHQKMNQTSSEKGLITFITSIKTKKNSGGFENPVIEVLNNLKHYITIF